MTPDETEAVAAERRLLRARALRACRPLERTFLRQLPKSRYEPYGAAIVLGMSSRTVWNMMKRPRVKQAMRIFLEDALDEIGVNHASLVADLVEIKRHSMSMRQVLDSEGKPTQRYEMTDARAAIAAIRELTELTKIAPPKRIEVSGSLEVSATAARAVADRLEDITDPNDAALQYQQLMYGKTTVEPPTSVN